MNLNRALLCVAFLATSLFSFAQENETTSLDALVTDRPDATESPTAMPKGFLQVETGAFFESFKDGLTKTETYTYNTTLVRYGVLNNLELRVGWDFVEAKTKINGNSLIGINNGFNPLLIGIKTGISKEHGMVPEIGLLGHIYLPFIASNDYKPENTGVDFRFSFAHTLSEKSSLSYNLGGAWGNDSPEASFIYTIAYGYGITNKLGIYAELYGDLPENDKSTHLWDAGLTYLISNNVQLDTTVGSSITKGQDLLLSLGISFRIPSTKNSNS